MNHCTGGAGAYAIDYLSYLEAWVEQQKAPDLIIGVHVRDAYLAALPVPAKWENLGNTPEIRALLGAAGLKFPLDPAIPIAFTRPIYPYPRYAKYSNVGDPNDAANFGPVDP
jgi:feruloyl esterase